MGIKDLKKYLERKTNNMTKEEFDKLYLGKAVHCDTEEKANEFLALADSVGYKWNDKRELINYSLWEQYKKETCYEVTKGGFRFANVEFFKCENYQVIKYRPQLKLKEGDMVRVNNPLYVTVNGKVGVIESVKSASPIPYAVKINGDDIPGFWYFYENQLEKVEEPAGKEKTIKDLIEEIKENQERTAVLLNRLEQELKTNERRD